MAQNFIRNNSRLRSGRATAYRVSLQTAPLRGPFALERSPEKRSFSGAQRWFLTAAPHDTPHHGLRGCVSLGAVILIGTSIFELTQMLKQARKNRCTIRAARDAGSSLIATVKSQRRAQQKDRFPGLLCGERAPRSGADLSQSGCCQYPGILE